MRNIPALMSEMVSDKAARTWLELWQELTSNYDEGQAFAVKQQDGWQAVLHQCRSRTSGAQRRAPESRIYSALTWSPTLNLAFALSRA